MSDLSNPHQDDDTGRWRPFDPEFFAASFRYFTKRQQMQVRIPVGVDLSLAVYEEGGCQLYRKGPNGWSLTDEDCPDLVAKVREWAERIDAAADNLAALDEGQPAEDERDACPCGSGLFSEWQNDARGIPLCRTCPKCHKEKLSHYRPCILTGYDQSDVDEPIEPD